MSRQSAQESPDGLPAHPSCPEPSRRGSRLPAAILVGVWALVIPAGVGALTPQPEAYCYAVADSGDNLVFINKDGDGFVDMGPTGTGAMEAIAFNPGDGDAINPALDARLFAVNGDDFGYLDYNDAFDGDGNDSEFIQISADVGTCTLPGGATVNINDIDGLQFDVTRYDVSTGTYVLWATVRDGDGSAPDDVLVQINPNNGLVDLSPTPGFTGGATCVRMTGAQVDIDDIGVKPSDGLLYAVSNTGGGTDDLVIVDPVTGATSIVSFFANTNPPPIDITDMEGLSFGLDSVLYGTTGASGTSPNDFWRIDTPDGDTTLIAPFPSLGDYEAVACLIDNLLTGTVFFDVDEDGVLDPPDGDAGFTGARVLVYIDNNNNNQVDGGDTQLCDNPGGGHTLACPITDPAGFYLFPVGQGNFVLAVDTATLPAGHTLTTDNIEQGDFAPTAFGLTDPNNDFGFTMPAGSGDLDITKTSNAVGPVVQGQTLTYTIQVTNNTGVTHNGIRVNDVLPDGVAYVPQSTVASGPAEFFVRDEFNAVSFANNDGSVNWSAPWVEIDPQAGGAGPAAGQVQIVGGALRLDDEPDTGGQPSAARRVDLTGVTTALLSFDFSTTAGVDTTDAVTVEVSSAGTGGPFTTLEVFTGIAGATTGSRVYNISGFISATTAVRFRVSANYGAADEFFLVDNVEIRAAQTFRDEFNPPFVNPGSFQRNNGTLNWATDWLEVGESDGPTSGDIQVLADPDLGFGVLRVRDNDNGGEGAQREANLSAYTSARLSLFFRRTDLDDADDYVTLEVSSNGGASWAELDRFIGPADDPGYRQVSYDISSFISSNTRIRVISSVDLGGGDEVYFDNVMIDVRASRPVVKDNVPGGANPDLVDGVPGDLVEAADRFTLATGQSMTVTFRVTVDNPLDPYAARLLNLAVVNSNQSAIPSIARHSDPVISGAVGDRVWLDTDGDGVQDVGEAGIANVQLTLYEVGLDGVPGGGDDVLVGTRLTGADGGYLFDHLAPGTYWVDVTDATLPAGLAQSPGNVDPPTDPVATAPTYTVTGAQVFLTADFGYTSPPGTGLIGDFVWNDMDRDGVQDPAEVGIGGVTLDLLSAGPDGVLGTADDVVDDTVTTAGDGSYLFTAVAAGDYLVRVTDTGAVLAGFAVTSGPQSEGSSTSDPVSLAAGEVIVDVDFGYAPGSCLPRIDFDTDAAGNPLVAGDEIDNQWSAWGVTVSFTINAPSTGPAMIFDSANPTGGDVDLGSPNETCTPPGPGQGTEGEVGQPGENCFPQGNVLILSEDGISGNPDDSADGGTITFTFTRDTRIESIDFLDAENALDSVELFDEFDVSIFFSNLTAPGDNAFELLPVNTAGARRMVVTFPASGAISGIDFCLGSLRDKVWFDANGDGLFELGEQGIAGVTVSLLSDPDGIPGNGDESVVATTVTDADGDFGFDGLADGDYLIAITDTGGELSLLTGTTAPGRARELAVAIVDGDDVVGINFGYNAPGVIGDTVWSDADGNGTQDAGEPGIAGVTVQLYFDSNGDNVFDSTVDQLVDTTVTAADGTYLFAGLVAGTYFASVDEGQAALAGYTRTTADEEVGPNAAGAQIEADLPLNRASFLDADFGYRNAALPDISGNVFEDLDVDGVDDGAGEPGFARVTLALLDAGGNVIATTTTDAFGDYGFADLPAGDYTVRVTDDARILDGYRLTSGLDAIDVTVVATDITGIDFGYVRDPGTASIGDTVWLDVNGDGVANASEPGLSGVVLDLWPDLDGDGIFEPGGDDGAMPLATTLTDANGQYVFAGLAAGRYFVDVDESTLPETTPGDLQETTYPAGVDPSAVIALSEGEDYDDADFGYVPAAGTGVLGDRVWYDTNADGLQDPGEIGIPGVVIEVFGPSCSPAPCTITTGPDGIWLATGLTPGDYVVNFDPDSVTALGYNPTPTNNGGDSTYADIALAAGDMFTHLDFGFAGGATGSIGDVLWLDKDGDGVREPLGDDGLPGTSDDETGLAGVTVNLVRDTNEDGVWDPDGLDNVLGTADDESILATAPTGVGGSYLFSGLPLSDAGDGDASDADYLIDVTDVHGLLTGLNRTSGTMDLNDTSQVDPYPVELSAGTPDVATGDFGYAPSEGTGAIGNLIWHDVDGDGVYEPLGDDGLPATGDEESGIQAVTVQLWLDDGDGILDTLGASDNLVRTAATDLDGRYEFNGLPAGTYFVTVSDANGVLTGFIKTSGTPGVDQNSQADPYRVDLSPAAPSDFTADFGYQADIGGSIFYLSGTVFEDADNDAVLDTGEPVVSGALLRLYRDLDGDGVLDAGEPQIGVTTSDAGGGYSFTDLPPGDYLVAADVDGTPVDGFVQTTQSTTSGVQPVTLPDPGDPNDPPNSTENDFGFWNGGITTTPVTLAYFRSAPGGDFEWATATETGNLGFNLYAVDDDGLRRLNDELIASAVVDSLEPQRYRFEAPGAGGDLFMLEDVDIFGDLRFHGPFALGRAYGSEPVVERIAWGKIRSARAAASALERGGGSGAERRPRRSRKAARLLIEEGGLYRVTYEELLAAGVDLGGAPLKDLALLNRGEPVPLRVEGQGRFGPGAFVEFVGESLETLYTRTNVYVLKVDRRNARPVERDRQRPAPGGSTPAAYLERSKVEANRSYQFFSPTRDPWTDRRLLAVSGPVAASLALEVDALAADSGPAVLELSLWGATSLPQRPDHHLVVEVNGTRVADEWFDGLADHPVSVELPPGLLQPAGNTLTLRLPHDTGADFDLVYFDHYVLRYPRRFEAREGRLDFTAAGYAFAVAGLPTPEVEVYRVEGGRVERLEKVEISGSPGAYEARFPGSRSEATYHVAAQGALRRAVVEPERAPVDLVSGRAELVVVAHADFLAGIEPLAARRRAEGLAVRVVDVDDVYHQFGHGIVDPRAIHDYLAYAHGAMDARYVLLVGGDTYDYHDYLGLGSISFIPSPYLRTSSLVAFAPVDPAYGDVDGDGLPEMAVGRFAVRTAAELANLVEKTLDYGRGSGPAAAVLAADALDLGSGYDFRAASEEMAALLPAEWRVERAYLDDLGLAGARQKLLEELDGGPLLASYFGHSGLNVWSFDGLFTTADADALENSGRPFVVTQWGCWNTYHVLPAYNTLGHRLSLGLDRGAAAVLGAATLTEASSERKLGRLVYRHLTEPGLPLGDALVRAKRELARTDPDLLDVLLGWTLLGDPTLSVSP